jgi:hypothetical protein
MSETELGITAEIRGVLVKWDGEAEEGVDPIGHPRVVEVLKFEPGQAPTVLYRRETWQT